MSVGSLFTAWEVFRRGKRSRPDIQAYERHLEENIFNLHDELTLGSYRHYRYMPFTICDPKQRQIHKATVQDRLVHQAVVTAIEPLFERQFIYDSYSCRLNKGTHAAVTRLQRFLRSASNNNTRTVYALKCDIKQFFASVDHGILIELIEAKIDCPQTLRLIKEIIGSFNSDTGKGIPLGNITSQLFANVYLHELDWFVKHKLRKKHYLRYCDDFIILGHDRGELLAMVEDIRRFLNTRLRLTLHPQKVSVHSWNQGIDFLGYVLTPHATVLRHKTKMRMLKRVEEANLTSYLSLFSHANAYELSQILIMKIGTAEK